MDPKDVPICYDFALLFIKQKKQKKLIKYSSVIGYLLGNPLGPVESRRSFKNPLANLLWFNPSTDAKGWAKQKNPLTFPLQNSQSECTFIVKNS